LENKVRTSYEIMKSAVDKSFEPTAEELLRVNPFFLIRYISNDPSTIHIANVLNNFSNIPVDCQYKFVRNTTIDKISFINYNKKEKIKDIELIMKHYNISESLAEEYYEIIKDNKIELNKLYQNYV
jgi:hypothetical protein